MKKEKVCKYCNTKQNLHKYESGTIANCCETHFTQYNIDKLNRRKQTNLERYGVESMFYDVNFIKKAKQTNLKRYGIENAFQKHKLENKLEKFDKKLSEYENMIDNGYLRIYDAGNYKLRLSI